MKTFLRLAGLMALAMPSVAAAQVEVVAPVETNIGLASTSDYVPARFSKDGASKLTFVNFNTEVGSLCAIGVDACLNQVVNIETEADEYDSSLESGGGKVFYKWDTVERTIIATDQTDWSVMANLINQRTGKKFYYTADFRELDGTIIGYVFEDGEASSTEIDGKRVPSWFFYSNRDGELIEVKCSGNCQFEKVLPEDASNRIQYKSPLARPRYLDFDKGTGSLGQVSITQTLFNSDDAYEYISPIYELTEDREDFWAEGSIYDNGEYFGQYASFYDSRICGHIVGFRIMSENGSVLQTVRFDEGLYVDSSYLDNTFTIITFGGKNYLSCSLVGKTMLYEIASQSGVQKVATYPTSIYPTLVSTGESVNVSFGEGQTGHRSISVNDLLGRQVLSASADASQGPVALPASQMAKGVNIVSVTGGDQPAQSTKVIVK